MLFCFFFRLSSISVRKDKFNNTSLSHTTPGKCFGQKSYRSYSTGNGSNSRWEYKSNPWYGRPLGKLVGALGTVAILGVGTVLSKSQEEKRPCDDETTHTILETSVKNEETQLDEDVVGRGRKQRDEVIMSPDTRLHADPSYSWDVKHSKKLSRHEESVRKARQILRRFAEEIGAPGIVVGVTVNGEQVWADGKYVFLLLELQ